VVERAVLKWNRVIKPPGELWGCYMSGLSASGDVAVAITYKKGANEYGELTLFNSDGKIAWSKHYGDVIFNPQLSDDGNIIAVKLGINTLTAYDKRGELLWTYSVKKKQKSTIESYKLSHDGRYAVVAVSEEDSFGWKSRFVVLRDGNVEWTKSGKGVARSIAISLSNTYIVSTLYDRGKDSTHVTLYTIDGAELWTTTVEGFPLGVDVSDNGEVLLTTYKNVIKSFFIAKGHALWAKDDHLHAEFTRRGDRIIAVRGEFDYVMYGRSIAARSKLDFVEVFDRRGKLLWEYRGMHRFAASDNYYVLGSDEEVVLVSAEGEEIQRIWFNELKEDVTIVDVKISPDGRYFAVSAEDDSEKMCYLYFFENKDPLIRVKERLLKEIDELIKR